MKTKGHKRMRVPKGHIYSVDQNGQGWFTDLISGIKTAANKVKDVAVKSYDLARKYKPISKAAQLAQLAGVPGASIVKQGADIIGVGRPKKMSGCGKNKMIV